ncbi:F26F24.11 [Salix purpurea]|uniref:F26F24.11 n=1 Tax=Salix purpurea TaxID=77065 RepID=A0A9Q0TII5_SALPP|nr:F26F24.11 [Salix purpurea]
MADFGFLSDTDDSAVDELVSQTQELCVLEQVSKINCSGLTDSVLPTDLETRFHKLKSFPLTKSKTPNKSLSKSNTDLNNISVKGRKDDDGSFSDPDKGGNFSGEKQNPGEKMGSVKGHNDVYSDSEENPRWKLGLEKEMKSGRVSSSPSKSSMEEDIFSPKKENPDAKGCLKKKSLHVSDHSNSWVEDEIFSPSKQKSGRKMIMKSISKVGSSNSSNSFMDSPSPPKKVGCFWCSPKRISRKQSRENLNLDWESNNLDEFLSDLSTFSVKEQQKRLKKAMKEQEKVSKEAEKIVKWAKQASARMSFHGLDDVPSDDEIAK